MLITDDNMDGLVQDFCDSDDSEEAIESATEFIHKVFGEIGEFLDKNEVKLTTE